MIKKYEIINDGGKKRIKALRSFHVQGRYVNIGDVGGIVYDENTLSQEGNCWIFSGNLNYPSIRVSGDSIVDTNGYEGAVTDPRPFVNITGTSALIGAHDFVTGSLAARELAVGDVVVFSGNLRTKNMVYSGGLQGAIATSSGEGYQIRLLRYNEQKKLTSVSNWGASLDNAGAYYVHIEVQKNPSAAIVPEDITAANVTLHFVAVESYLDINDSRLEFQYTSAMTVATKVNPGNATSGVRKSVIDTSNVIISKTGNGALAANIFADVVKCNVAWTLSSYNSMLSGDFRNIYNLILDGTITWASDARVRAGVQVYDCYDFLLSSTVIPTDTINAVIATGLPLTFIRCNVPNGIFYHNATVKNIYTDIDFAKASVDLGKTITGTTYKLVSSEVEGMYRIYDTVSKAYGYLVEAYDSVAGLTSMGSTSYDTTIYKDAYISGKFDFAGTNVFGNKVPGHPRVRVLNVQSRAVQGDFNTSVVGQIVTGIVQSSSRVSMLTPLRTNGAKGFKIDNIPNGVNVSFVFVNPANNAITVATGWSAAPGSVTVSASYLKETTAFLRFRKTGDADITPEDLAGVTVTVYNGCKIINTGATAVNMKGNIRVEDNATLVNASVTGSGYFGGNSVVYYNPAVWASLDFVGTVYMKDKAVFAPTALTGACALVRMEGNAKFSGSVNVASTNLSFIMRDNAVIEGKVNTRSGVVMSGNSKVAAAGQIMAASRGVLVMEDNASIEASTTVIGAITLSGNYKGNVVKTWTGKRTITDVNAPEYDDNVKTEYDF